MALKGKPVAISNSSTLIYTCPSGVESAVHGLLFSNNTGSPLSVDVIVYNQADATSTTVATDLAVAANSYITWSKPMNLNAGDTVSAVSSASSGLVCLYSVYEGSAAPVATGFTGRGVWSSSATYAVNDIVTTNAGTYLALQGSTNQDPATATAYWMFLQGVSASALPSQTGQTGKFLTTNGTEASWQAISSESLRKALPLKSGASLTAGRAVNINSSGEVGDYPVVNTLGTLVTSTTTAYSTDFRTVSTDGSRVLTLGISATSPYATVRGTAITGTTTTTGALTNLSPSGSFGYDIKAYPLNATQFLVFYTTTSSDNPWSDSTHYYTTRVVEVDSSGGVTLGTAAGWSGGPYYWGYGINMNITPLSNGRYLINTFSTNSGGNVINQTRTLSISGTTITTTTNARVDYYSTGPTYTTTGGKMVGIDYNTVHYANYDGTTVSSAGNTNALDAVRGSTGYFGALLNASYGIFLYQTTSNDVVLRTVSINQTTGVPTTTANKVLTNNILLLTGTKILIVNATDVIVTYKLAGNSYLLSLKLNASGEVTGQGIPLVINNSDNEVYAITSTGTSGVVRYFFNNASLGNSRNVTIGTYNTLAWSGVGATATTQASGPAEIITSGICAGFTGLTPGLKYYVDEVAYNGSVTTAQGSFLLGTAVSSTEILLG